MTFANKLFLSCGVWETMRRFLLALLLPAATMAADLPALRGLSRSNLLLVSPSGQQAKSVEEWQKRRTEALEGFQAVAGRLPGNERRGDLAPKVLSETDCGSYVRRLVEYCSQPGARVPAWLCIPKKALAGGKSPAILCLHPTENKIGHDVVVGLGGKPHRQYAAELAERGFITLAPSYPLLAKYQPDLKALNMPSGTIKAIWDNIRGLDYLETLPFVDAGAGFAAIGHSLGGHNSIFTASFEPRIKVVVTSCGFDSLLDYYGGNIKGYVQERYMMKMQDYLGRPHDVPWDYYELIAALAPRHLFINAPLRDANFRHDSVDRIAAAAEPVFQLHNAIGRIVIRHPDSDHDFPDAERLEAYALIEKVLRGR